MVSQSGQRPRSAYLPWGAGGHACIGKRLALMVVMAVVSAIAQQFQIQLVSDQPIEIDPRSTLRPKGGIQVRLKR